MQNDKIFIERPSRDYPNYAVTNSGGVKSLITGKILKDRSIRGLAHVTIKHNGNLKHVCVQDLMESTFTNKELYGFDDEE